MAAINAGVVGQRHELAQCAVHLRRRALKDTAAAAGKQGVAAKQHIRAVKGNVAAGMGGHFDHRHFDADTIDDKFFALAQLPAHGRNPLFMRAVDRHFEMREQPAVAANVVGMVMRVEDGSQGQLMVVQIIQYRRRVAGINHRGIAVLHQSPDVVVVKG